MERYKQIALFGSYLLVVAFLCLKYIAGYPIGFWACFSPLIAGFVYAISSAIATFTASKKRRLDGLDKMGFNRPSDKFAGSVEELKKKLEKRRK